MESKDYTDEFGNYWPASKPVRMLMSAEEFSGQFKGYPTIAVEMTSDRIYAAGDSEENLVKGIEARNLECELFQLEPGPLNGLNLEKLIRDG
ncbi:hypothetical protein J4221_00100 [Candidatus Pacearchaeota archaeon]|nr:hypothetical protein [Candidatus Pacearchaeota archaeon]